MYLDHISTGDSKQDYIAVMSYFDAACKDIKARFPHIVNLYVQSDNARCYKKGNLVFALYKITEKYNLTICSYIHTGVQDGKGCIDAHFSMAMHHVLMYCNMGSDVITPIELVDALNANGGVNNTVADLVGVNRPVIQQFEQHHMETIKKLKI